VHLLAEDALELARAGDPIQLDVCEAVLVPQVVCNQEGDSSDSCINNAPAAVPLSTLKIFNSKL